MAGVGLILVALFMLAMSGIAFLVAYAAVHIWLLATIWLRLLEGRDNEFAFWFGVLVFLLEIDAAIWW
jgi:hypothetical protein